MYPRNEPWRLASAIVSALGLKAALMCVLGRGEDPFLPPGQAGVGRKGSPCCPMSRTRADFRRTSHSARAQIEASSLHPFGVAPSPVGQELDRPANG